MFGGTVSVEAVFVIVRSVRDCIQINARPASVSEVESFLSPTTIRLLLLSIPESPKALSFEDGDIKVSSPMPQLFVPPLFLVKILY